MRKSIVGFALILITIVVSYLIGVNILYTYIFPNSNPFQPIAFSHKIHVKKNEVPCLFCHIYAAESLIAGVPSVQKCVGCHNSIKRNSPEIKKIFKAWTEKKPVKWIRVYDLPDYIYFSHKRHVKAKVRCQECHGPVETMERITKYSSLGMGWCLSCHYKKNGPIDCWECHI